MNTNLKWPDRHDTHTTMRRSKRFMHSALGRSLQTKQKTTN